MPYSSTSEVPSYVPKAKKKQWMEVWNSAYQRAIKHGKNTKVAEESAFAQANGVAGPNSEKVMKTDGSKLYEDTGTYNQQQEDETRGELVIWANYAESGPTFDPEGKYLCGGCCMRSKDDRCLRIVSPVNFSTGSCRIYMHGEAEDEDPMPEKLTQIEVDYTERPNVKGFGCVRCMFGAEAKAPDMVNRTMWCALWGVHVTEKACCFKNTGDDDVFAPVRGTVDKFTESQLTKSFEAVRPLRTPTDLSEAVGTIAYMLNSIVADSIVLYIKTKNFHWHVVGPHFRDYHLLFDEQADVIFGTIDPVAERVRKLGGMTIQSLRQALELTSLKEDESILITPQAMLQQLLEDNKKVVVAVRKAMKYCGESGDGASENLLQDLIDGTERRIWFLYSALQQV